MVLPAPPREQRGGHQSTAAQAIPPPLCWYSCLVSYAANQMGMQMCLKNTLVNNKFYARPHKLLYQGGKKVAQTVHVGQKSHQANQYFADQIQVSL